MLGIANRIVENFSKLEIDRSKTKSQQESVLLRGFTNLDAIKINFVRKSIEMNRN